MALVNVTHKPTGAKARQFDGSLASLTDIVGARASEGVTFSAKLAADGSLAWLNVSGGTVGSFALNVGDWAVFPTDPTQPAFALPAAQAGNDWQIV